MPDYALPVQDYYSQPDGNQALELPVTMPTNRPEPIVEQKPEPIIHESGKQLVPIEHNPWDEVEFPKGHTIINQLFGTGGEERYKTWPEKLIVSALTAPGDALAGKIQANEVDPITGDVHTSREMIGRALDMAALAGTGGLTSVTDGTLGSTPFLRPALKYKDKLYKGKEGQQHADVIPDDLYPDFQKKAMSGEDINDYNFGFVNDKGHFLDRESALKYGIDTGLIDSKAGKFGALTSTLMADSSKPGTAIEALAKTKELPSSSSLFSPPVPSLVDMAKSSKIEKVPLSQARGTNKLEMDKFDKGQHPDALLKGYEDKPVAAKREDGEYIIFDGHHRIIKAIENGDTHMDMHVIDAKSYAPEFSGIKLNVNSIDEDNLLKELGYKLKSVDHDPFK